MLKAGEQDSSCLRKVHTFPHKWEHYCNARDKNKIQISCSIWRIGWRSIYRRLMRFFVFLQQTNNCRWLNRLHWKPTWNRGGMIHIYMTSVFRIGFFFVVLFFYTLYRSWTKHTYQMCYTWEYLHFHIFIYCALVTNSNPEMHITISSMRANPLNLLHCFKVCDGFLSKTHGRM